MKTIFEHIEHVKGKPHHIRKQIAFTVAGAGTAVVALVWLASSIGTGAFALKDTSFAQSTGGATQTASPATDTQGLAGVAASGSSGASAPARIEIIDTSSSAGKMKAEQTTIPF